ncbi:hypothetical protein Rsub_03581 [Raphidocelis subcapitata]|uniref:Peptidase S1 domain-containing protein n=1 Tax=Raphidocelis subcapitata TaxID=307507 RepID=A0A2V0NUE9_9CHLO|nr:hypothetical protein Rsub_03581 [Raphidocelis subcapitata]|eukprot:GBF91261.1 hypothetical protein Rsub_03581 [Raphidocelis subcapitata]
MAPPVMKSRGALAVAAALAVLLACAAPSAAQGSGDFAVFAPGEQLPAGGLSSKFVVVDAAPTTTNGKAVLRRTTKERSLQLTPEQAALVLAPTPATAPTDAPGVESAASYAPESGEAVPLAQGTSGYSFTDTRVARSASAFAPFVRPAGKLTMRFGGGWATCTASLIGKSLLVTAAHCVYDWGSKTMASEIFFTPDFDVGSPSTNLEFKARSWAIPSAYAQGTDTCQVPGVVCSNDVAVVWLGVNSAGQQAFQAAGNRYFNYMVNAFEATAQSRPGESSVVVPKYLAISQLGYPGSWDGAGKMQMSNSPGFQLNQAVNGKTMKNIVRGTAMTGGSSGGPWLLNLGVDAAASDGVTYGSVATRNAVVGVTSWGYTDNAIKLQGASQFATNAEFPSAKYGIRGGGNIGALVDFACDSTGGWGLQAKGFCR